MQELWFLHSAYPLMLVDICMKFHDASLYGLKVIDRTRWRHDFVRDKVQREITKTRNWLQAWLTVYPPQCADQNPVKLSKIIFSALNFFMHSSCTSTICL